MAALISSVIGFTDKMVEYIGDCLKMGIAVLPPHVNESGVDFTAGESGIRFGLVAIKNIGFALMEELVREREENGLYRSYCDFLERMADKGMNKKAAEMLISAGALDGLGANRRQMLMTFEMFLDDIGDSRRRNIAGQTDLFSADAGLGDFSPELPNAPEIPAKEMLALEKASTGMYLSGHPMADYQLTVDKIKPAPIHEILASFEPEGEPSYEDGQKVTLAGIAISLRRKATRSNTMMGFLILEDMTAQIECIVFPKTLERVGSILEADKAYAVRGRITAREDEEAKIVAEEIVSLDSPDALHITPEVGYVKSGNYKSRYNDSYSANNSANNSGDSGSDHSDSGVSNHKKKIQGLFVKVASKESKDFEKALSLAEFFSGNVPLYVYDVSSGKYSSPGGKYAVDASPLLLSELKELLGENAVVLKE
jgi:DNA polymerase-3 subunit alpha